MDILSKLNASQGKAATSSSPYLRIIAGAGTGKTRTLTYRVAYLLMKGLSPNRIVCITFTNKVAKEMRQRVEDILEENRFSVSGFPLISTFHGFCYRFLKTEIDSLGIYNRNFSIIDDDDRNRLYKEIFTEMGKKDSKDFCRSIVSAIDRIKTEGRYPEELRPKDVPVGSCFTLADLEKVYSQYQDRLRSQNLLDFDDLLILTVQLMRDNPAVREHWKRKFDHILVDEFQDTNGLQYQLLLLFMGPETALTVVGDPDQTIYTWRGAKNDIIKNTLQKDFPALETVVLDENYRSTQNILDRANCLIKKNRDRIDKDLQAASHVVGEKVDYHDYFDNASEAREVSRTIRQLVGGGKAKFSDIAVIYRSNYLSNVLERQLALYQIPYRIYGGMKFFERKVIKDALAYLRLAINPDDYSFLRILQAPTKGIGEVTLEKAKALLRQQGRSHLLEVFRLDQEALKLKAASRLALGDFYRSYDRFLLALRQYADSDELYRAITTYLEDCGFFGYVRRLDREQTDRGSYVGSSGNGNEENVQELLHTLQQFFSSEYLGEDGKPRTPDLEDFLIEIALQSDQDTIEDGNQVSLMTGHVSKGLEFPYVFVTGLNENIFPTSHAVSTYSSEAIEEERRLAYVCMTRAQKRLFLSSFGGNDFIHGGSYRPSRFLTEAGIEPVQKKPADYQAHQGTRRPSSNPFAPAFLKKAELPVGRKSTEAEKYAAGDKVVHTSFGIGEVVLVEGNKIDVLFPEPFGRKRLVVGFKAFHKLKEE